MGQHQSIKPEPNREEPEVDLEPIRKVYDVATKVIKLGRRWIKTRPHPDVVIGFPPTYNEMKMLSTFMHTFNEELFGVRARYLQSKSMQTLISKNRSLSDAIEHLESTTSDLFMVQMNALLTVDQVRAKIDTLELSRDIIGDVLDDLEANETPFDLVQRSKHSISGKELPPSEERLRARLELILDVFKNHGAGPFRAKIVAKHSGLHPDAHLRSDLSVLKSLGYLGIDGRGYLRTDKPYPMS
jgi:hypothetical protein